MTETCLTEIDPTGVVAEADKLYHRGNCDGAIGLLVAAGEQMPPDWRIQIKLAELLMDSEHFQDALSILEKVSAQDNKLPVIARKGYCAAHMGDYRRASELGDQLLALAQDHPAGLHLKGLVAYQTGFLESAEQFFNKALTLDPNYGEAYTHLGLVKKKSADDDAALDLMEKGFESAPTVRNVALAYHNELIGQSDFDRAEKIFQAAVAAHPGNQRLLFLYTDILLRLRKAGTALNVIQECLVRFGPDKGLLDAALQVRNQMEHLPPDDTKKGQKNLSLCMIVKNEEMHLARCLMSVQALVDEVILVDTGSTDLTVKIGRAFGAKIYPYEWGNDFAEARNFSLSKATGDWILILDADEVISRRDQDQLRSSINNSDQADRAFTVITRNYTNQANLVGWTANQGEYPTEETGSGWYPSPKVRLFPNDPRIRFRYPIHELVEPSLKPLGISIQSCPLPVHHYGKLNGQKNEEKANAYYALGLKKLETLGDNAVAIREMAVQAAGLEKFSESADLWRRYLELDPDCAEAYVNMGTACWQISDYQSAVRHAEKAISLVPEFKEAHFNSALAYLHLGECQKAISIYEMLLETQPDYLAARLMLACAYACGDRNDKAQAGFNRLRETLSDLEFRTAVSEVADRLEGAGLNQFAENLKRIAR